MTEPLIIICDSIPEVDRLIARLQGQRTDVRLDGPKEPDAWLSTREAATYLSMTPNALHKLTAAREIPFAQPGGFGGKCYFKRSDLDDWLRS